MKSILRDYFYWTYARGSVHYDIMVSLILLFIFVTPHLWSYGDMPASATSLAHPIQVIGDGGHGVIVTLKAADVPIPEDASDREVKKILRSAIEPVTGDAVFVEHWQTERDAQGNLVWRIWAHR